MNSQPTPTPTGRTRRFSLEGKVIVAFAAAAIVLVGVSVEAYRAVGFASESAAWVNQSHLVIEALSDAVSDVVDAETAQRGYLLTQSPRFLAPYDTNVAELAIHLDRLQRLTVDNPMQRTLAESVSVYAKGRMSVLQSRLELARAGKVNDAVAEVRSGGGVSYMDSLRDVANRMDAEERRLLSARAALERERRRYLRVMTGIGLVVALATALFAVVAILGDVSARDRVARELAEAASREADANRAKSEFLARMSHELRTPLNSVIGFASVLLKNKGGVLRAQELSFVERIRSNGTHLLGIINDILDLSKVESGRMDVILEPVDVNALVRETLRQINPRDGVELDVALPGIARPLSSDRDKLKQVLLNLVANALKFTERGRVLVRVVTKPSGAIRRIDVVDTGPGIPRDRLDAIFDAFEQAEATTTRRYGGTGLGLTISRAMCERMGFRLDVASAEGVGSTFSILCDPTEPRLSAHLPPEDGARLEAISGEQRAATPAASRDESNEPKATILVIDDSADSRLLLGQFLEDDGKRVVAASSGEQGLQLARQLRPRLIVLDLVMPGLDGWRTLHRLKNDAATADIPVVVVSIVASEQRGSLLGAVDLVDKPIDRDRLLATIRRNLGESGTRVLVVEDSADTRTLFQGYLNGLSGLTVHMAATGKEALARLDDFHPELVILDLSLPDMDGLELLCELRAHETLRDIPVIIATARDLSADERADLEARTQAVITKDDDIADRLRETVRAALPQAVA
jgi:signal transduction histidine kinase/CheY-like chemotaxis protein